MNKDRRKKLVKASSHLQEALDVIQEVSSEEAEAYENMPENLLNSERTQQMQECIETLVDVEEDLEERIEQIEEILDS